MSSGQVTAAQAAPADTDGGRKVTKPRGWIPRLVKPAVFLLSLVPLVLLAVAVFTGNAGANPIETVERDTGEWTLRFLCLTLFATPLSRLFKTAWPVRLRRMIGLFAFFYAALHLLSYLWLDHWFAWSDILADILKRPYVTIGFLSFLILLPLAVTSNRWAVKKLARRWAALHRWVYLAAVLGVIHFVWLTKGDQLEPVIYLLIILGLLAYRMGVLLKADGSK